MFGFEKWSVSAWVEDGLTKQLKVAKDDTAKRRSGSWKIIASVLVAAAASTSTVSMAQIVGGAGVTDETVQLSGPSFNPQRVDISSPYQLTAGWHADSSELLRAGIAPTMSDEVRALALKAIEDQKKDADDDIDAWARSLVESMYS
ncbi:hypothetical protein [Burkholderia sp. PR2]|uniref:hypothetical protein n=1 Tax=Burkholderia sp. PR2 TaxID=3448078 RepID=UPI00402AFFBE